MVVVGVLRSGGDTRFALLLDAGATWLAGIPLVLIGAFVLHLPLQWVYMLMVTDELIKLFIGLYRLFSKRWINNLTLLASGL
jgi:Na+-driven multidrug efflux pump